MVEPNQKSEFEWSFFLMPDLSFVGVSFACKKSLFLVSCSIYHEVLNISPRLIEVHKDFQWTYIQGGFYFGGFIFGGSFGLTDYLCTPKDSPFGVQWEKQHLVCKTSAKDKSRYRGSIYALYMFIHTQS